MSGFIRRTLVLTGIVYALSLPLSFVIGGALFARPTRTPVKLQTLADAMDPSWDRTFLSTAREVRVELAPRVYLAATVIAAGSSATVILWHPSRENRAAMVPQAYSLWEEGFDVVLVDRRAHGSSDGDVQPLFGGEAGDIKKALDALIDGDWCATGRIGLYGRGDGATACLLAAADDERVDAVVGDSPSLSASDFVSVRLADLTRVPAPLLFAQTWLAVRGICFLGGVEVEQLDARSLLPKVEQPVLLLSRRELDGSVQTRRVADRLAATECEVLSADDAAGHGVEAVADFFHRAM